MEKKFLIIFLAITMINPVACFALDVSSNAKVSNKNDLDIAEASHIGPPAKPYAEGSKSSQSIEPSSPGEVSMSSYSPPIRVIGNDTYSRSNDGIHPF